MLAKKKAETEEKIKQVLNSVRPYLVADGGNIQFVALTDDMTVQVVLTGACNACGMSYQTLKGVESAIIAAVPEVKKLQNLDYGI